MGVFLVMQHPLQQLIVVVATDGKLSIVLANELHHLTQFLKWKSAFDVRQIELAQHAIGHRIAMQNGRAAHGKTLESMPHGVAKVEHLAQTLFTRILLHNAFLHRYRSLYQR